MLRLGTVLVRLWPWNDSFVAIPLAAMLANVLVASLTGFITSKNNQHLFEQGKGMSALVSQAAISIVTLTFSLTVLSVQVASQTYSPRLLEHFVKDPMSKMVISVNLGAYAYCYTMTYYLYDDQDNNDGEEFDVPYVSIHLLSVHMALVLISFVSFIHFFINGFRIEAILERASNSCLGAAKALSTLESMSGDADQDGKKGHTDEPPEVPSDAYKVMADASGYVTRFRLLPLVAQAKEMDICVRYTYLIGDFVNEGTCLCYVWDAKTRQEEESVNKRVVRAIQEATVSETNESNDDNEQLVEMKLGVFASQGIYLSKKRSGDFDVTLGIQQLSDIAVRALSPGVNDPQTAVQCMDVLSKVLIQLSRMDFDEPQAKDDEDNIRLSAPKRSFAYILSLIDSIRRYGASDLTVCRRGLRLFGDLAAILTRSQRLDRVDVVVAQLEQWMAASKQNFQDRKELNSLKELYDKLLRNIGRSDRLTLEKGEAAEMDLQELETTHKDSER